MGFLSRFLVSSICALALVGTCGLAGATSSRDSAATIYASMHMQVFYKSAAKKATVVYAFSAPSKSFAYRLTFKAGSKWQTIKSVKKTGSFSGTHTMTVKKVFGGKAIKAGTYRLKLSTDGGSKSLRFIVLPTSGGTDGGTTPTGSAPVNASLPTISGVYSSNPKPGKTLYAKKGSWYNSPTSYSYQWLRCSGVGGAICNAISWGGTFSYLKLTSEDIGYTIRVKVTASNAYGKKSATSNQTVVVVGS